MQSGTGESQQTLGSVSSSQIIEEGLSCSLESTQSLRSYMNFHQQPHDACKQDSHSKHGTVIGHQHCSIPNIVSSKTQIKTPCKNSGSQTPCSQLSIERVRLMSNHQLRDSLFESASRYDPTVQFVGFVGAAKGQRVLINSSKIKRARNLLDSAGSRSKSKKSVNHSESSEQFSSGETDEMPTAENREIEPFLGFKNAGSGSNIHISDEMSNLALKLLHIDSDSKNKGRRSALKAKRQTSDVRESKQTRPKNKQSRAQGNDKTAKPSNKTSKLLKKPGTPIQRKYFQEIRMSPLPNVVQTIKLADLRAESTGESAQTLKQKLSQFSQYIKYNDYISQNWVHIPQQCSSAVHCYFCKKYPQQNLSSISMGFLIKQLKCIYPPDVWGEQSLSVLRLGQLYRIIVFKLIKYKFLNPEIRNKQPTANNVLLEMHQKCLKLMGKSQHYGPLSQSTCQGNEGRCLNLLLLQYCKAECLDTIYLLLTDGWSCVYGVLDAKNELYRAFKEGLISYGSKISIVDWNKYLVNNILDYYPSVPGTNGQFLRKEESVCGIIEFRYNTCRLVHPYAKLGFSTNLIYRSIQKCQVNGGLIPLTVGIVVRMFSSKNYQPHSHKPCLLTLIEILTYSNQTLTIALSLPEDLGAADLFNLYGCYGFRKLKKTSANQLQFVTDISRYYECACGPKQLTGSRESLITQLLKYRLLNTVQNVSAIVDKLDSDQAVYADVITKVSEFRIGRQQFRFAQKISPNASTGTLFQQFRLLQQDDVVVLTKGERGAEVSRIPRIYKQIPYNVMQ